MNLENQKENVNILLELIKENPNLPIVPLVNNDFSRDDDFSYSIGEWSKAEVTKYYCINERMYEYTNDFEELVERWKDENYEEYPHLSDEELEKLAEDTVDSYEWVKAIIVYIENT